MNEEMRRISRQQLQELKLKIKREGLHIPDVGLFRAARHTVFEKQFDPELTAILQTARAALKRGDLEGAKAALKEHRTLLGYLHQKISRIPKTKGLRLKRLWAEVLKEENLEKLASDFDAGRELEA